MMIGGPPLLPNMTKTGKVWDGHGVSSVILSCKAAPRPSSPLRTSDDGKMRGTSRESGIHNHARAHAKAEEERQQDGGRGRQAASACVRR